MIKNKINKNYIYCILAFIVLGIIFFGYSLIVPPDGSMYYYYTSILDGDNPLSTWSITRGPSFPIILYIFKHLFGNNSIGILFGFYIFYFLTNLFGFKLLNSIVKNKKHEKLFYFAYIILVVFNPLIFGYSHTLLTEAIVPFIILICTILCYKWGQFNCKIQRKKSIIYTLLFSILLTITWFIKQPYAAIIFFLIFISSILSGIRFKKISVLIEKITALFICCIFLILSIVLWNTILEKNHVDTKAKNSSNGYLAKGILDGINSYYIEDQSSSVCDINYINKTTLSDKEKKTINDLAKKQKSWCNQVKLYNLYSNNRKIKTISIITDKNGLKVSDSLQFLIKNTLQNPLYTIKAYTKNYLSVIDLYEVITLPDNTGFRAGNNFSINYEHENTSLGTVIYNNVPNCWWQYSGTSEQSLIRNDVTFMKNFEGFNEISKEKSEFIKIILPFYLYAFKILFLIALPLFILSIFKLIKNNTSKKYFLTSIIFGSSFLHVLFHASMGALIDRYAYVALPISIIGIIIFFSSEKENITDKKQKREKNSGSKTIIIIPAYNEEANILKTYNSIIEYNKEFNKTYDVIVINDGSTDKTENILYDNNIPHITLIHNLGIGGAVQTGYRYALENNYDIAVQFDGDGQHDINYVKNIIEPIIKEKADFVIGSRYVDAKTSEFKSTLARQMGIKLISFLIKLVTRKKVLDTTSGFRACNQSIIKEFANSYPTEYPEPITTTELLKKGYELEEVAVSMNEREAGQSSIRAWKNVYYMINVYLSIIMVGIRRYK